MLIKSYEEIKKITNDVYYKNPNKTCWDSFTIGMKDCCEKTFIIKSIINNKYQLSNSEYNFMDWMIKRKV